MTTETWDKIEKELEHSLRHRYRKIWVQYSKKAVCLVCFPLSHEPYEMFFYDKMNNVSVDILRQTVLAGTKTLPPPAALNEPIPVEIIKSEFLAKFTVKHRSCGHLNVSYDENVNGCGIGMDEEGEHLVLYLIEPKYWYPEYHDGYRVKTQVIGAIALQ